MRSKIVSATIVILLGLLIVPVIVTQLIPTDQRDYEVLRLEDTIYTEISFFNATQDINLGGLLFIPEGDGSYPVAVIIHGSGTSQRDNGWYLTLVDYLQNNEIAVLLPDKRGSEQSEGNWQTSSFEDLATDTLAAIEFLKQQDLVSVSTIGIIGMSQGGHIAPLVANQSPDVSFVINVVGAAVSGHEQLLYEEIHNLREIGFLPGFSNLIAYPTTFSLINVTNADFWGVVGNFDPLPYWNDITANALVLYGENDTNVPTEESARRLRSLNNSNIDVRVYEASGHALEDPEGTGNSIFREDALEAIRDFIISNSE